MGCRIFVGHEYGDKDYSERAHFFCSTTGWAFGPMAHGMKGLSAMEVMDLFQDWLPDDAREYEDHELESLWGRFYDWIESQPGESLDADELRGRLGEITA